MSDAQSMRPPEPVPDLELAAELLLDAASSGRFEREMARLRMNLDRTSEERSPLEVFRFRALLFDVAMIATTDPALRFECAEGLLNAAAEAGEPAWTAIRESSRLGEVESLTLAAEAEFSLLELLAYSTDSGMRSFALSRIEAVGMRELDREGDSRVCERLLHAVGATQEAYRLESDRKARRPELATDVSHVNSHAADMSFRTVAIAGGHAQLRVTAATLLQRYGIDVVAIPSSREAVRRERDIVQLLQRCDLAILLVRQITHSTSDQVRKSAERIGLPVLFSNAQSAVSVERQIVAYASTLENA